MHDCARDASCGCHGTRRAEQKDGSVSSPEIQESTVQGSNGYTSSQAPQFTDAG